MLGQGNVSNLWNLGVRACVMFMYLYRYFSGYKECCIFKHLCYYILLTQFLIYKHLNSILRGGYSYDALLCKMLILQIHMVNV